MAQPRWLAPWKDDLRSPAIYHVINRVVDRRFAFGDEEKEKFRMFMRMVEEFSGCQVLSYCVMSNHFHILLEVAPMIRVVRLRDGREVELSAALRAKEERAKDLAPGISPADLPDVGVVLEEKEFFQRLKSLYSDAAVGEIASEFAGLLADKSRAILIGEESGGNPKYLTGGDIATLILPNSKIKVHIPLRKVITNIRHESKTTGVIPDYEVSVTIEDRLNQRDPIMNFAKKLIEDRR